MSINMPRLINLHMHDHYVQSNRDIYDITRTPSKSPIITNSSINFFIGDISLTPCACPLQIPNGIGFLLGTIQLIVYAIYANFIHCRRLRLFLRGLVGRQALVAPLLPNAVEGQEA
jgi:hypothetical protein